MQTTSSDYPLQLQQNTSSLPPEEAEEEETDQELLLLMERNQKAILETKYHRLVWEKEQQQFDFQRILRNVQDTFFTSFEDTLDDELLRLQKSIERQLMMLQQNNNNNNNNNNNTNANANKEENDIAQQNSALERLASFETEAEICNNSLLLEEQFMKLEQLLLDDNKNKTTTDDTAALEALRNENSRLTQEISELQASLDEKEQMLQAQSELEQAFQTTLEEEIRQWRQDCQQAQHEQQLLQEGKDELTTTVKELESELQMQSQVENELQSTLREELLRLQEEFEVLLLRNNEMKEQEKIYHLKKEEGIVKIAAQHEVFKGEIRQLSLQIETLEADNQLLREKGGANDAKHELFKGKISQLNLQIETLEADNQLLRQEKTKADEGRRQQITKHEERTAQLQQEAATNLEAAVLEKDRELEELRSQMQQEEQGYLRREEEAIVRNKAQHELLKGEICQIQEQAQQKEAEAEEYYRSMGKKHENELLILNDKLSAREERIAILREEIVKLEASIVDKEQAMDTQFTMEQKAKALLKERIQILEDDVERADHNRELLEEQNTELTAFVKGLEQQLQIESESGKVDRLQEELQLLREEEKIKADEHNNLIDITSNYVDEAKKLKLLLNEKEHEMEIQLEADQEAKILLEEKLKTLQDMNAQQKLLLDQEIDQSRTERAKYENQVTTLQDELSEMAHILQETEQEYLDQSSATIKENKKLQEDKCQLKEQVQRGKTEAQEYQQVMEQNHDNEILMLNDKICNLTDETKKQKLLLDKERDQLQEEIQRLKQERNTTVEQYESQLKESRQLLEEQVQKLEETNAQQNLLVDNERDQLQEEIQRLKQERNTTVEQYESQLKTLPNEISKIRSAMEGNEREYLLKKKADMDAQNELKEEIVRLKDQIELEIAQAEEEKKQTGLTHWEETTTLKGKMSNLERTITKLELTISRLKANQDQHDLEVVSRSSESKQQRQQRQIEVTSRSLPSSTVNKPVRSLVKIRNTCIRKLLCLSFLSSLAVPVVGVVGWWICVADHSDNALFITTNHYAIV